jgi:uncharacterized repeat protein (TIGR02543 family)
MSATANARNTVFSKKLVSLVATLSLALAGVVSIPTPANAGTDVDVYYFGNTIGTSVPASTTADRDAVPLPVAASVSGSRTGYTFGGWSPTVGGAPITEATYRFSSTATRLDLYAVWNTTIFYDGNGADGGDLPGAKTNDVYRYGQSLTLPTVGTLTKSGHAFGGWMTTTLSTTRLTTYAATSADIGNVTLYAAWIKTVSFNANTATSGTIPFPRVFTAGGAAIKLPVLSEMTLRKAGHDFVGWSTTSSGLAISNPMSYIPLLSQQTLYAVWKVQGTKASLRVFFNPGKSALRPAQKLILRDLSDSLKGRTAIKISLAATRARSNAKSLSKARNTAVVTYLNSLGVVATYTRINTIGSGSPTGTKSNRVTISASWTNPTS